METGAKPCKFTGEISVRTDRVYVAYVCGVNLPDLIRRKAETSPGRVDRTTTRAAEVGDWQR